MSATTENENAPALPELSRAAKAVADQTEKRGQWWEVADELRTVLPAWAWGQLDDLAKGVEPTPLFTSALTTIIGLCREVNNHRSRLAKYKGEVQSAFTELVDGHSSHLDEDELQRWAENLELEYGREEEVTVTFTVDYEVTFNISYSRQDDRGDAIDDAVQDWVNNNASDGTWSGDWDD